MSERRLIHPDIFKRLRWLAGTTVAVVLLLLAYAGLQDCRGGRAIVANHPGSNVEARIELASTRHRVVIWDRPLRADPVRVFFPTEIGDSYFVVTVTHRESGEVSTYEYGYLSHKGGSYYFIVGETDVFFASTFMGYFEDPDHPKWITFLVGALYMVSDELTCVI